jgi:hypothetical protein
MKLLLASCLLTLAAAASGQSPVPSAPPSALPSALPYLLPYAQAVADRFPLPAVRHETPGLQPGRQTWTDNSEMEGALRGIAARGGARLVETGRSGTGRPLLALHFSRGPGRPVALVIGQQHGNEPAGGEAVLAVAQQLADPQAPLAAVLDRLDVVVLPRANPDGAALNRRTNAAGLDINRDHLLLRTPEADALAGLVAWLRPVLVVDAHEHIALGRYMPKFGAIKGHDLLVQYATTPNLSPALTEEAEAGFRQPLLQALDRAGITHEWYYTNPTADAELLLTMGGIQPDLARNVGGLRHAVSFLLESRGFDLGRLHAERRVHTHVVAIASLLGSAALQAGRLTELRAKLDAEVSALACRGDLVVEGAPVREQREMRMIDPDTGADKRVRVEWDSALQIRPVLQRARPCGYWLAADSLPAVERLHRLGVLVRTLPAQQSLRVERYRETARGEGERSDTLGRVNDPKPVLRVTVALEPGTLLAPAGSFYVPLDQPLAHLVTAALEPDTQNSWFAHHLVPRLEAVQRVMAAP